MADRHMYAVETRGICKYFGKLKANDHIDLKVKKQTIHAIIGENGAGKSTLMNMLSDIYKPDSGEILLDGAPSSSRIRWTRFAMASAWYIRNSCWRRN